MLLFQIVANVAARATFEIPFDCSHAWVSQLEADGATCRDSRLTLPQRFNYTRVLAAPAVEVAAAATCGGSIECAATTSSPCDNLRAYSSQTVNVRYQTPQPQDLYQPYQNLVPTAQLTFPSCRACIAQCRYDIHAWKYAINEQARCVCGQVPNANAWMRAFDADSLKTDETWSLLTIKLDNVINASDGAPATTVATHDALATRLSNGQNRRYNVPGKATPARSLLECQTTCAIGCYAWVWDDLESACEHVRHVEPYTPLKGMLPVQTQMRWYGNDTGASTLKRVQNPFQYGATAPVKDNGVVQKKLPASFEGELAKIFFNTADDTQKLSFDFSNVYWCGEHAACGAGLFCNCTLADVAAAGVPAAAVLPYLNLGIKYTVQDKVIDGGSMGNVYATYTDNANNAKNPYIPTTTEFMPVGTVPGAPWPNAAPPGARAACPTFASWQNLSQYQMAVQNVIAQRPAGNPMQLPRWRRSGEFCAPQPITFPNAASNRTINACDEEEPAPPSIRDGVYSALCAKALPQLTSDFWTSPQGRCQALWAGINATARCFAGHDGTSLQLHHDLDGVLVNSSRVSLHRALAEISATAAHVRVRNALAPLHTVENAAARQVDAAELHDVPAHVYEQAAAQANVQAVAPRDDFVHELLQRNTTAWNTLSNAVRNLTHGQIHLFLGFDPYRQCVWKDVHCNYVGDVPPRTRVIDAHRFSLDDVVVAGRRNCETPPPWRPCRVMVGRHQQAMSTSDLEHVCNSIWTKSGAYPPLPGDVVDLNPNSLATFRRHAYVGQPARRVELARARVTYWATPAGEDPEWVSAVGRMVLSLCEEMPDLRAVCASHTREYNDAPYHVYIRGAVAPPVPIDNFRHDAWWQWEPEWNPYLTPATAKAYVPAWHDNDTLPYVARDPPAATAVDVLRVVPDPAERHDGEPQAHLLSHAACACAPRARREDAMGTTSFVPQWSNYNWTRFRWSCWLPAVRRLLPPAPTLQNTHTRVKACKYGSMLCKEPARTAYARMRSRAVQPIMPYAPLNEPARAITLQRDAAVVVKPEDACIRALCPSAVLDRMQQPPTIPDVKMAPFNNTNLAITCDARFNGMDWGCADAPTLETCADGSGMTVGAFGEVLNCRRAAQCTVQSHPLTRWPGFVAAADHIFSGVGPGTVALARPCTPTQPRQPAVAIDPTTANVTQLLHNGIVYDFTKRASHTAHERVLPPRTGELRVPPFNAAPSTETCVETRFQRTREELRVHAVFVPASGVHTVSDPLCFDARALRASVHADGFASCAHGVWRQRHRSGMLAAAVPHLQPSAPGLQLPSIDACAEQCSQMPLCRFCTRAGTLYVAATAGAAASASESFVFVHPFAVDGDYTFVAALLRGNASAASCAAHATSTHRNLTDRMTCQLCTYGHDAGQGFRKFQARGIGFRPLGAPRHAANATACFAALADAPMQSALFRYEDSNQVCQAGEAVAAAAAAALAENVYVARACRANPEPSQSLCSTANNTYNATHMIARSLHVLTAHGLPGMQHPTRVPTYAIGSPVSVPSVGCVFFVSPTKFQLAASPTLCANNTYTMPAATLAAFEQLPDLHAGARSLPQHMEPLRCASAGDADASLFGSIIGKPNFDGPNNCANFGEDSVYTRQYCVNNAQPCVDGKTNATTLFGAGVDADDDVIAAYDGDTPLPVVTRSEQTAYWCSQTIVNKGTNLLMECNLCTNVTQNQNPAGQEGMVENECTDAVYDEQCAYMEDIGSVSIKNAADALTVLQWESIECKNVFSQNCSAAQTLADAQLHVKKLQSLVKNNYVAPLQQVHLSNETNKTTVIALHFQDCAIQCAELAPSYCTGYRLLNATHCDLLAGPLVATPDATAWGGQIYRTTHLGVYDKNTLLLHALDTAALTSDAQQQRPAKMCKSGMNQTMRRYMAFNTPNLPISDCNPSSNFAFAVETTGIVALYYTFPQSHAVVTVTHVAGCAMPAGPALTVPAGVRDVTSVAINSCLQQECYVWIDEHLRAYRTARTCNGGGGGTTQMLHVQFTLPRATDVAGTGHESVGDARCGLEVSWNFAPGGSTTLHYTDSDSNQQTITLSYKDVLKGSDNNSPLSAAHELTTAYGIAPTQCAPARPTPCPTTGLAIPAASTSACCHACMQDASCARYVFNDLSKSCWRLSQVDAALEFADDGDACEGAAVGVLNVLGADVPTTRDDFARMVIQSEDARLRILSNANWRTATLESGVLQFGARGVRDGQPCSAGGGGSGAPDAYMGQYPAIARGGDAAAPCPDVPAPPRATDPRLVDLSGFAQRAVTGATTSMDSCVQACADAAVAARWNAASSACACVMDSGDGLNQVLAQQLQQCAALPCDAAASTVPCDTTCGMLRCGRDGAQTVFLPNVARPDAPLQSEQVTLFTRVVTESAPTATISSAPTNTRVFPNSSAAATTHDLQPWVMLSEPLVTLRAYNTPTINVQQSADGETNTITQTLSSTQQIANYLLKDFDYV